jgi:hypothetical protein
MPFSLLALITKTSENRGLAIILRLALSFPIFLRMDAIPQEVGITLLRADTRT